MFDTILEDIVPHAMVAVALLLAVIFFGPKRRPRPPKPLKAPKLVSRDDDDDDDEGGWSGPRRVIWIPEAEMDRQGIPWERRIGNPKENAIWRCRYMIEPIGDVLPSVVAPLLEAVAAWEASPGQAPVLGQNVYRHLQVLERKLGSLPDAHVFKAVLKAVWATPPSLEEYEKRLKKEPPAAR